MLAGDDVGVEYSVVDFSPEDSPVATSHPNKCREEKA